MFINKETQHNHNKEKDKPTNIKQTLNDEMMTDKETMKRCRRSKTQETSFWPPSVQWMKSQKQIQQLLPSLTVWTCGLTYWKSIKLAQNAPPR